MLPAALVLLVCWMRALIFLRWAPRAVPLAALAARVRGIVVVELLVIGLHVPFPELLDPATLDTVGPMARSVYDVAALLSVIAGVDAADAATRAGEGHQVADYTQALKADALKGARIGVARDFFGQDDDVDWVMEASLEVMRKQGATIVAKALDLRRMIAAVKPGNKATLTLFRRGSFKDVVVIVGEAEKPKAGAAGRKK